jgi:hypothetical protein
MLLSNFAEPRVRIQPGSEASQLHRPEEAALPHNHSRVSDLRPGRRGRVACGGAFRAIRGHGRVYAAAGSPAGYR